MPRAARVRRGGTREAAGRGVAPPHLIPEEPMTFAVPAWDVPTVPVHGSAERFPVRHIYCVGRNYAEHAKEMGGDASKEPPFFFTQAADSIVPAMVSCVGSVPS